MNHTFLKHGIYIDIKYDWKVIYVSVPVIDDRDREEVINDLLQSIALEEAALAHLINAEAEKVQWSIGTLENQEPTENNLEDVLEIQEAVEGVMRSAIKFQMLLQFKLEDVSDLIEENNNDNNDNNEAA